MKIGCPRCGRDIPGADIDLAGKIAVCRPCGEVLPLATVLEPSTAMTSPADAPLYVREPPPPLAPYKPVSLRWDESSSPGAYLAVTWPSRLAAVPTLLFACVWDGFLLFWYAIAIRAVVGGAGGPGLIMLLFPILHLLAGVWVTHSALTGLFNKTRVTLDRSMFRIARGPIPQRGSVGLPSDAVEGFALEPTRDGKQAAVRIDVRTSDGKIYPGLTFTESTEAEFVIDRLTQELARVKAVPSNEPYR